MKSHALSLASDGYHGEKGRKAEKADLVMQLAFWQKLCQKELQGTGSLITPERKVPQRLDASQNDHKSKGYPSKTSEAVFTMQKADKGDLRRLVRPPLK